jgi:hypothetical protein
LKIIPLEKVPSQKSSMGEILLPKKFPEYSGRKIPMKNISFENNSMGKFFL